MDDFSGLAATGWQPPAPTTAPRAPRPRRLLVAALAVVLAGVGLGGGAALVARDLGRTASTLSSSAHVTLQPVPQSSSAASAQTVDAQAVASKVSAAVVDVDTTLATADGSGSAAGTGMILTSSGLVLTNNHVVRSATSIRVTVSGRGTYTASVVGVDPGEDVALLQIKGVSGLPTVTLADSSTLSVGEAVVALGNAGGRGGSPAVTQGTITALDQSIVAGDDNGGSERLTGLIESDASISAGDSGGPLVNAAGQVVGMITAGESSGRGQTSTTVGYAIASDTALRVVDEIESGQPASGIYLGQTSYLGVAVTDANPRTASSGALVVGVASDSPAGKAGITRGAVITQIGNATISSAADVGPAIWSHAPGQKVAVTWVDQDGNHTASVTLVAGPAA